LVWVLKTSKGGGGITTLWRPRSIGKNAAEQKTKVNCGWVLGEKDDRPGW